MVKEGFTKVTFEERLKGGRVKLASADRGMDRTGGGGEGPEALGVLRKLVLPCSLHVGVTRAAGGICFGEEVSSSGAHTLPFRLRPSQLPITRSCADLA